MFVLIVLGLGVGSRIPPAVKFDEKHKRHVFHLCIEFKWFPEHQSGHTSL